MMESPAAESDLNLESDTPQCRICHEGEEPDRPLFYPCKCSGSIKFIHEDCLMTWLQTSKRDRCDVCKELYQFRTNYTTDYAKITSWAQSVSQHALLETFAFALNILQKLYWLVGFPIILLFWCTVFWNLSTIATWRPQGSYAANDGIFWETYLTWMVGGNLYFVLSALFDGLQKVEMWFLMLLHSAEQDNHTRRQSRAAITTAEGADTADETGALLGEAEGPEPLLESPKPIVDRCWQYTDGYTENWSAGLKFHVTWLVGTALFIILPMLCAQLLLYACPTCAEHLHTTATLIADVASKQHRSPYLYLAWYFGNVPGAHIVVEGFVQTLCALQRLLIGDLMLCGVALAVFAVKYAWLIGPCAQSDGRRVEANAQDLVLLALKVVLASLPLAVAPAVLFVVMARTVAALLPSSEQYDVHPVAQVDIVIVLALLPLFCAGAATAHVRHVMQVIHATVPKQQLPRVEVSDLYAIFQNAHDHDVTYSLPQMAAMCLTHLGVQLAVYAACVCVPFCWGHLLCPLLAHPFRVTVELEKVRIFVEVLVCVIIFPSVWWSTDQALYTGAVKSMVEGVYHVVTQLQHQSPAELPSEDNSTQQSGAARSLSWVTVPSFIVVAAFIAGVVTSWVLRAPLAVGRTLVALTPQQGVNDLYNYFVGFLCCGAGVAAVQHVCDGFTTPEMVWARTKEVLLTASVSVVVLVSSVSVLAALESAYIWGPFTVYASFAPGPHSLHWALVFITVVTDVRPDEQRLPIAEQLMVALSYARQRPRTLLRTVFGALQPLALHGLLIPFVLSYVAREICTTTSSFSLRWRPLIETCAYHAYLAAHLLRCGLRSVSSDLRASLVQGGLVTVRLDNRDA